MENTSSSAKAKNSKDVVVLKLKEIKTFIYSSIHNSILAIEKPFKKLWLIHDRIKQIEIEGKPAYLHLFEWMFDIVWYGFLLAFVYVDIFIINGKLKWILFPFSLGIIRWLWIDFVENTSQAIRRK